MRELWALIVVAALIGCTARGGSDLEPAATRRESVVGPLAALPIGKLVPASPGTFGSFGNTLAVHGERIAAGVANFDDGGPRRGAVFVFERGNGTVLQTDQMGLDDRVDSFLGTQVVMQGNRLAVQEFGVEDLHRVAVYAREPAGGWALDQRIVLPPQATARYFTSLALSNDTIVVGTPLTDGYPGSGSARVFVKGASGWTEQARLLPGATPIQSFGQSVAIENDVVAVGFYTNTPGPSVWVFERRAGRFTEVARLAAPEPTLRDGFGQTLAISAGRLFVGAPSAEFDGLAPGAVYEFVKFEGQWQVSAQIVPQSGEHGAEFGGALAADWPWILIGAPLSNQTGAAFLFSTETGEWLEELRITAPEPQSFDDFGRALALDGNLAAIGAPGTDDFGFDFGVTHVFALGLKPGQRCSTDAECAGYCSRGMCCDRLCVGGCEACSAAEGASADGVCTPLPVGTETPACAPFLCNGDGQCPFDCSLGGCNVAFYCNAASGQCRERKAPGAECTTGAQCVSEICDVDTCCDRECRGCSSCRGSLTGYTHGFCAPVLAGTDPSDTCPADPGFPESCAADGKCDGGGQCRSFAPPTTACGPTSCSGGTISGKLCNGQGTCGDASASCAPNQCRDGLCSESCRDDADCADSAKCQFGLCMLKRPIASACQSDDECASRHCSDGVCCRSACTGQCEYCGGENAVGTCIALAGDPAPGRAACEPPGSSNPCVTSRCDGRKRDGCVEAVLCTQTTVCDGDHQLLAPGQVRIDCSPYRCDPAGVCRSQCSSSLECASGNRCNSKGECVRRDHGAEVGCACRSTGSGSGLAPGASIFALGLLLLQRRRRVASSAAR
jgi:hypothetical protein